MYVTRVPCVCPGPWPFNLLFPVILSLFWSGGSFMALIIWNVKTCMLGPPRPLPPSVPAEAGWLLVGALPGHQCIWFSGQPVTVRRYFSMAYYSVVSYWCKWCMLPCSQRALNLVQTRGKFWHDCRHGVSVHCLYVQILSLYATRWPVFPTCMQLILVSWYVASKLCCHCWMFSLSDSLAMQSYPSKVWFHLVWQCISLHGTTYLFFTDLFFYMKSVVYHGQHFEDVDFIAVKCSFY